MFRNLMLRLFTLMACLMFVGAAHGAGRTFYVDFENGADDADGVTPQTAFRHAPGDPQAGGKPKDLKLQGGDVVCFKGGVAYRGTIHVQSGSENSPIIYDGNSAGAFGQGKAIIDGSELITDWKPCASADEAGGNPNWKQIFYATIQIPKPEAPAKLAADFALSANLVQDGKPLELSRDPNPNDPFFLDELDNMRAMREPLPTTAGDVTTVINPDVFNQPAKDAWDGAYMEVWLRPNWVHNHRVLEYDPGAHLIKVEKFKGDQYPGTRGKFAMVNHVRLIDRAGEFATAAGEGDARRVYLWAKKADDKGPVGQVTYSVRPNGFVVGGKANVEIRNFVVEKQGGDAAVAILVRSGSSNVVIRKNEVRFLNSVNRGGSINIGESKNVLVDGNSVHHNRKLRGIAASGEQITFSNNTLEKNGGTGIGFFGVKQGRIIGNTVSDHAGVHANGLTVYANSEDVLVEGNRVFSSRVSLTLQEGQNITIQNNVFERGVSNSALAIWPGKMKNVKVYHNLLLKGVDAEANYLAGIFTNAKAETIEGLVVKNNIIDGLTGPLEGQTFENNLYLSWGLLQKDKKLGPGEMFEADLNKIFVDPAKGDYRLKPGSPAIGKGADVGVEKDFSGMPRPKGSIDIGPYQQAGN